MKKFTVGTKVTYRDIIGVIQHIDKEYVTVCFLDRPDPTTKSGRYQACLLVYRNYWDKIYETPS